MNNALTANSITILLLNKKLIMTANIIQLLHIMKSCV